MLITLEVLAAQEKEILEITSTLRAMLSADEARLEPVSSVVRVLVSDLCQKVRHHLDREDAELYPDVLSHADDQIRNLVWGFQASDRPLCREFEQYYCRWLKCAEFILTEEFIAQTLMLLSTVEERIERERMIMLPQLQESGFLPSTLV